MALEFPDAPIVGQTVTFGLRTWTYNGEGWQHVVNFGQILNGWVPITLVHELFQFPESDPEDDPTNFDWYELTHL